MLRAAFDFQQQFVYRSHHVNSKGEPNLSINKKDRPEGMMRTSKHCTSLHRHTSYRLT